MKQTFKKLFGIDPRTLALFRVGLGIILIADILARWAFVRVHYSDVGIMPRAVYLSQFADFRSLSIHLMSGTIWFQSVLFSIAIIAALALLVGYRTTLANVISWFLLISIHNRNPDILDGGDILFRLLLFWGMFLPLGALWSVDRARTKTPSPPPDIICSGASFALLIQMASIYLVAALLKTGPEWHNGTAVYYALQLDHFTTPFAKWLLGFPSLLPLLTKATLRFEFYGPIFLFLPFSIGLNRVFLVSLFFAMHLGFGLSLRLGLFPLIAWVGLSNFLPSEFWDTLERWFAPKKPPTTLYFDDDCTKTSRTIRLYQTFLLPRQLTLIPRSEAPDEPLAQNLKHGWLILSQEGPLKQTDGFKHLLQYSALFGWSGALLKTSWAGWTGTLFYHLFNLFGWCCAPLFPGQGKLRQRTGLLPGALAMSLAIYVSIWNVNTLTPIGKYLPRGWQDLAIVLRLDQWWNMFAPYPMKDDGWFVIPATLENGKKVDLFRGGAAVSWKKPKDVASLYQGQRWRKYYVNLWNHRYANRRVHFGGFLCRQWNRSHRQNERIKTLDIYYMLELTTPTGTAPVKKIRIWQHWCRQQYAPPPTSRPHRKK